MKQLDWKSFAIGVLLTTSVLLGTGAATSTSFAPKVPNYGWDVEQLWDITYSGATGFATPRAGYEPFHALERGSDHRVFWRKRIK
tara:strand:- start:335 stop:589 length:255 start_codon:yes stop_codon:yes gene_type:complete